MTGALKRVLVRPPLPEDAAAWREYGWRSAPDPRVAAAEHEALCLMLEEAGADVVLSRHDPGNPDAIYAYDPMLPTDRGVIALRPGKPGRRDEPGAVLADLEGSGFDVLGSLTAPAIAEGGDMFWLDDITLLVGRSYRTNDAGIAQIRSLLGSDVDVCGFDLPHFQGPDSCLHLMSFISPLDLDLAVVYAPMVPVRMLELLRERGISLVSVPDDEFATQGPNVLALGPRVALALEGSPETRRRLEAAGVDVRTYVGDEISRKGDGGPTCLTRPLARA